MSRTYRNTKSKQGAPKWSQYHFNQYQLDVMDKPLPKKQTAKYKQVPYVKTVYAENPPKDPKSPRWVSKGTPLAVPEWTEQTVLSPSKTYSYRIFSKTGRWYIPEKDTQIPSTYRARIYDWGDWTPGTSDKRWEHQAVVQHTKRDKPLGRRPARDAEYKHQTKRASRREMKISLRDFDLLQPDQLREDMLNVHLEPHNWLLDESPLDYYDSIDEFFWDDCHEEIEYLEENDDPYDPYDDYDIDYCYDDWGDWH